MSYLEPEKILNYTELFKVIHPKKSNEMKNKWCKNLVKVINYLINFTHNEIKYGVYFLH